MIMSTNVQKYILIYDGENYEINSRKAESKASHYGNEDCGGG